MAGAPDQSGLAVHIDPVRSSLRVTERDGSQNVANGPFAGTHLVVVNCRSFDCGQFLTYNPEPEGCVGGIAIGRILAMNRVGQRAVFFEVAESNEKLANLVDHSRR